MNKCISTFIAAAILLNCSTSLGDWASEDKASYQIINSFSETEVDEKGNSVTTETNELKALTEKGRSELVMQTIPHIPDAFKTEVLAASSFTDGVEEKVDIAKLQFRAAPGDKSGMSNRQELVIPFNNIKIGSNVKWTIKRTSLKGIIPGYFETSFSIGMRTPELAGGARVVSKIPIYLNYNDPWKVLEVKEYKDGEKFVIEFKQTKPLFKLPIEFNPIYRDQNATWVYINSLNSWSAFLNPIAEKYEKILTVKSLPVQYQNIVAKAAKEKDVKAKIDVVVSELITNMTYSGDWTSQDKFFVPRDLATISKLNTGDCKDFSVATTAMLRQLGIKANIAFTRRKNGTQEAGLIQAFFSNTKFPQMGLFNHAIVKVEDGNNVLWVDPTNIVTNAGYAFHDIAGSMAIEVVKDVSSVEKIPYPAISESKIVFNKTVTINEDNTADSTTEFEITGAFPKVSLEQSLRQGEEVGKKVLMSLLRTQPQSAKSFYTGIDFKTRIAKNLKGIQKSVGETIAADKEGKKYVIAPLSSVLKSSFASQDRRVTDFAGVEQLQEKVVTKFVGLDFVDIREGCTVLTPWFNLQRAYFKVSDGFEVRETFENLQNEIPLADVNSDKYQMALRDIIECVQDQAIEVKRLGPQDTLQTRLKDYSLEKAKELFDQPGAKSVQGARESFHIVNQLLEKDPENKELLILKARAYRRVGFKNSRVDRTEYLNSAEAILDKLAAANPTDAKIWEQKVYGAYYKKDSRLLVDLFAKYYSFAPKDYSLYMLGGVVSEQLKSYSTAKTSYLKALELGKDKREKAAASSAAGEVAFQNNQNDEAIRLYKQSLEYVPENSWTHGRLIDILSESKKLDEAIAVGEDLIKKTPYGIAKKTLADTYAMKAREILYNKKSSEGPPGSFEELQKQAEETISKGLRHDPQNVPCLDMMANIYFKRANEKRDLVSAQKSINYFEKKYDSLKQSSSEDFNIRLLKKLITELENGSGSRLPAQTKSPQ